MSQTIFRATELLELIAEQPRSLAETAKHFEVHRSTVFRQLQTLERAGFIIRRTDGQYAIGPKLIYIAQRSLDNINLRRVAQPHIEKLHANCGGTVHLAQLMGSQIVYIDKLEDTDGVRMYSRIGKTVLPQATGVGKLILSQLPISQRDAVLKDTEWVALTPTTITSREMLDAELAQIAKQGWGVDNSEFEDFTNCISAPVSNSTGDIVGAISITTLKAVRNIEALSVHRDELLATAATISRELG